MRGQPEAFPREIVGLYSSERKARRAVEVWKVELAHFADDHLPRGALGLGNASRYSRHSTN